MNEELEKAYEADKERKAVKHDELKAARDYVGVLLEEAEGRNAQLENKKQETDKLNEKLSEKEAELDTLIGIAENEKKKNRLATFWMCFALFELLMIVVFAIVLIVNSGSLYRRTAEESDNGTSLGTPMEETVTPEPVVTGKYVTDLSARAAGIDKQKIYPFSASVETIDGLEYLVFSSGGFKVCYKNEYSLKESRYSRCLMIESGSGRYSCEKDYDLSSDLALLAPSFTKLNDRTMLAFIEYGSGKRNIPSSIRIVDCETFHTYTCSRLSELINNLMKVRESEELSVYDDAPIVYTLTTARASYKYTIPEEYYNEIAYNSDSVPEIDSEFSITVDEEGISWKTNVKLGDRYYLGQLTGNLNIYEFGIGLSGSRFGAFVPADQEDTQRKGFIRPAQNVPKDFLTIGGYNNETFYVSVNDEIPLCVYDWDKLNSDDPDNWYYTDDEGGKISIRGIDVSRYQGNINWAQVAEDGVEFAMIRLGFRGMNQGTLEMDEFFAANMKGTRENGIKAGVYFFSQAVNEKEALQEAEFVLNAIKGYDVEYPVVIDTERISGYDARANSLSREERTQICRTFCEKIAEAGYRPMIYANTKYMVMGLDLTELKDIDKWFAVYSDKITFPYDFQMLQYSESGKVKGISGNVDLNISFTDYSR